MEISYLGYAPELYNKETLSNLDHIRNLRNTFAHAAIRGGESSGNFAVHGVVPPLFLYPPPPLPVA